MKQLSFDLPTGDATVADLRPILDRAIRDHFTEGFLSHRWEGDVLRLSGPGATGSIVHDSGRLRLRAQLRAPASLMHGLIRRKIEAAFADVEAALSR